MNEQGNPFHGFSPEKQAEYEKQLIDRVGEQARSKIVESKRRAGKMNAAEMEAANEEGHEINRLLVECIERGDAPNSDQAQKLVARQHAWVSNFWTPNKNAYIGLGQSYCDNQDFRDFYDKYDKRLVEFLAEAMKIYALEKLD